MPKEKITLDVPVETARAFQRAGAFDRARAERAVTYALQTPAEAAAELERVLDAMGTKAKERGLTDEELRRLLNEEF